MFVFAPSPAQAKDHITQRAWLEDPSGQLSWADVQARPTQPFSTTLNRGFGTEVVWLRLRIDPQAGSASGQASGSREGLVLRIRPAYLDDIQLFDPLVPDGHAGTVGDRHHPRRDVMPGADFQLPIARGDTPRDIWLRLQSTSTRQIHVSAVAPDELGMLTLRQSLVACVYIGIVLSMMIWGFMNRVIQREGVMGAFALMQLSACLFALSTSGILRVFWPLAWRADTLDTLGSVFSVVVVGFGIYFHIRFLRDFQPARWAMRLLQGLLILCGVNLLLLTFGHVLWALESNMVVILLAPALCLVCAVTGRVWKVAGESQEIPFTRRVLVGFYVVFMVIFLLASTTGLGWAPANEWTIYISQLHTLVTSLLLLMMLQYRAHMLSQQRQQTRLTLEKTALQVVHEQRMREEQERLLAMLAHEIKTPLTTMHLRLDDQSKSGRDMRLALREMNNVIDRCLQTLQIGDGRLKLQRGVHNMFDNIKQAVSACSQPDRVVIQAPHSLTINTDPQIIFIVLSNLLENACKYSASDTPIRLLCSQEVDSKVGPVMRLELINLPGKAGLPDAEKVFDKYYRAPKALRQSGSGLGLYLAESFARTLGGRLTYEPEEPYVRFVLTLPLQAHA